MNLVNYEVTGMTRLTKRCGAKRKRLGVEIVSTEIGGLVPEKALDRDAEYFAETGKLFRGQDSGACV